MKTVISTFFVYLTLFVVASFSLVSCNQDIEDSQIGKSVSFELQDDNFKLKHPIVFQDGNFQLSGQDEKVLSSYLNAVFSEEQFSSIGDIELAFYSQEEQETNEIETIITVAGVGVELGENSRPVAVEFAMYSNAKAGNGDIGGIGGGVVAREKHTCSGRPCSCCSLKWKRVKIGWSIIFGDIYSNRVVGCQCNQNPASEDCPGPTDGHCDHTVSTLP